MGKMKEKDVVEDTTRLQEAEAIIERLVVIMTAAGEWRHVDTPGRRREILDALSFVTEYKNKWKE